MTLCTHPGCENPAKARELCHKHYSAAMQRIRRGTKRIRTEPIELGEFKAKPNQCRIPSCERTVKQAEVCKFHYVQYWRAANPDKYKDFNKRNASARRARLKGEQA